MDYIFPDLLVLDVSIRYYSVGTVFTSDLTMFLEAFNAFYFVIGFRVLNMIYHGKLLFFDFTFLSFKDLFSFKYVCVWGVCTQECSSLMRPKHDIRFHGAEVTGGCVLGECKEPGSGLLEEWYMILTVEPSLL